MPKKKVRPKGNRKKQSRWNKALFRSLDKMENTIKKSILDIDSQDGESSSSGDTRFQNLSEIGECRSDVLNDCGDLQETDVENLPEKNSIRKLSNQTEASLHSFENSKLASYFENIDTVTAVDDLCVCDDSDSTVNFEIINPTTIINNLCIGQPLESSVNCEKISETKSINNDHDINTGTVSNQSSFVALVNDSSHCKNLKTATFENDGLVTDDNVFICVEDSEPVSSEISISEAPVNGSHFCKGPDFVNFELSCSEGNAENGEKPAVNECFGSKSSVNDSQSEIPVISENVDSINCLNDSRFSKTSESSVNSLNVSSKQNKKRKRNSNVCNDIFSKSWDLTFESSEYYTPVSDVKQISFHDDAKFYSGLSEIFNTPLSSRDPRSSAKTPFRISGESSPIFSCSSPSCSPLSSNFNNLYSSSDPVLRSHSARQELKNCSRSTSQVPLLLKEKNYSRTLFQFPCNSDDKATDNYSNGCISSIGFLDQSSSFNKENEECSFSKKRGTKSRKKNSLKRVAKIWNFDDLQVRFKSSNSLLDNDQLTNDNSSVSLNESSSQGLFMSPSNTSVLPTEFNGNSHGSLLVTSVTGEEPILEASDESDFHTFSATLLSPFPLPSTTETGLLHSREYQRNVRAELDDEVSSPTSPQKKDQTDTEHMFLMTSKSNDWKNRLEFGSSTPKTDIPHHSGTPIRGFSVPVAGSSLSLQQVTEACKRIAIERLPNIISSYPRWPIYLPLSRIADHFPLSGVVDLISWIIKNTARGVWNLRAKVSKHSEMEWNNVVNSQNGSTAENVASSSPAKLKACCSCQFFASVMPTLISKIETLDNDIKQIKSLLVQRSQIPSGPIVFGAPPAPPPPPPPPPPPSLLTPLSVRPKQNEKAKTDCKKKDEMTRPPITVEDLRRVTLRKTPLPQHKERKISTDPRCPVVSLEMLRSVKLRPRRRIVDNKSIKSFLAKSSRERSDMVDRILNSVEDTTSDFKVHLVDSDVEENPSKKSRTEIQDENE